MAEGRGGVNEFEELLKKGFDGVSQRFIEVVVLLFDLFGLDCFAPHDVAVHKEGGGVCELMNHDGRIERFTSEDDVAEFGFVRVVVVAPERSAGWAAACFDDVGC